MQQLACKLHITVGNTINTTSGNNIAFTLSSGLATPTSFTLTNSGTAPAFIVNTPATGTQNAISVQQNSINTLTIDEAGDLATAGTIATTNTTASTNSSTGALTVSGGAGIGGALNVWHYHLKVSPEKILPLVELWV